MLSREDNERLTRVSAGTPTGDLMRRYWLPAALSRELPDPDGSPIRVRLLGEDLVAFRTSSEDVGLVSAFCPHRRAPMFFGRNEEGGLRCVYHGWKFDRSGSCVDMPSEPADSLFKTKVQIESYPTWEGGGIIWTYMGPQSAIPPVPNFELVRVPDSHKHVSKTFEDCNYLQALEGGLDTAHSSFAHNMNIKQRGHLRTRDKAPQLEVERTDYGFRYAGIRNVGAGKYVRVYHYIMPVQQLRGLVTASDGGLNEVPSLHGHFWVPIDDTHTFTYNFMYSYDPAIPITEEDALKFETYAGRGPDDLTPDFHLRKSLTNDYFIDREVQKHQTFTGITGINTQDFALQEGMGPIVDRTREHLGTTDRAIITCRQLLLEAGRSVEQGDPPRGSTSSSAERVRPVDLIIPAGAHWQTVLEDELSAKF
jgi:phthalate 4,5-dioxygenase oxygenase subunit